MITRLLKNKFISYGLKGGLALLGGLIIGYALTAHRKIDYNKVILRYSIPQKIEDYDLQCATNYLIHRLKKAGFEVIGKAYADNLYNPSANQAGISIFVRGFTPFYDIRFDKDVININYLHRGMQLYFSEMFGYDMYLSSQKKYANSVEYKVDSLPNGYVPHEKLSPKYQYNILYIYEYYNPIYSDVLKRIFSCKSYGGAEFARLGIEKQKEELRKAKLVVYEAGLSDLDDKYYVPYAVTDIISYGRPVLTNYSQNLLTEFPNLVGLFRNNDELIKNTYQMLELSDEKREENADKARNILYNSQEGTLEFISNLLKIRRKSF